MFKYASIRYTYYGDTMKSNIKELLDSYQVRKSYQEKSDFIAWLNEKCTDLDYTIKIEADGTCRNLVIGNPKDAKLILTAHYDTQPNAFIHIYTFISNHFTYFLSQIISLWPFVIYYIVATFLASSLELFYNFLFPAKEELVNVLDLFTYLLFFAVVPLFFCINMMFGIANKHTANDNTSGVATLLSIMEDLSKEDRNKVCFVFFDLEEAGLIGSGKFKAQHKDYIHKKPLINFDCVSDGSTYVFVSKKDFRNNPIMKLIEQETQTLQKPSVFKKALIAPYMSDQIHFKNSVGVVAAKHIPIFGYYLNRIHSYRDKIFQNENIIDLSTMSINVIKQL